MPSSEQGFKHRISFTVVLCVWIAFSGAEVRGVKIENVLLIVTDDQSAQLECYGTRGISSPATSRLPWEGVMFRNAYSTCAFCSPARSSILTGMYPHSNGHWRNTHAPVLSAPDKDFRPQSRYRDIEKVGVHEDIPTLIEILNRAGFITGITQKFHLSPPWKFPFTHRYPVGNHPDAHGSATNAFLEASADRPFFLMANIGNTHRPFSKHIVKIAAPRVNPSQIEVPANVPDTFMLREDMAEYLDTVQCADACTGAILDALKASGRYDHTLIVFTSDQGYCYHRAKATAYDLGVHVPLVIAGPGLNQGLASDKLVSHVDLVPTILDLLDLPVHNMVQGKSLRALLEGRNASHWRTVIFPEHNSHGPNPNEYYPIRGVFDGRFHYLRNLLPKRRWTGDPDSLLVSGFNTNDIGFAGPADAFPGGSWDNHSYEVTVLAKEIFSMICYLLPFNGPERSCTTIITIPLKSRILSRIPAITYIWIDCALRWMTGCGKPTILAKNCATYREDQTALRLHRCGVANDTEKDLMQSIESGVTYDPE